MRHGKYEVGVYDGERLRRKRAYAAHVLAVQRAYAFQPHLVYLLEVRPAALRAVDALAVIQPQRSVLGHARVFHYAERDVGFERHKFSAEALEREHGLTAEKVPVVDVKGIFLELFHLVQRITVTLVERAEFEISPFVLGKSACVNQHCRSPARFLPLFF